MTKKHTVRLTQMVDISIQISEFTEEAIASDIIATRARRIEQLYCRKIINHGPD